MKKLTRILAIVLGAGLVFATCTKDETMVPNDNQNQQYHELGALLLPAEEYARIPVAATPEIDFRLKAAVNLNVPSVGNQGGEGSCVAWGTAYAGRSIDWQASHPAEWSQSVNIFSPEYVYNQIKVKPPCSSGAYVITGLNLLVSQGVCTWTSMPYTDVACKTLPTKAQKTEAANYKIVKYSTTTITTEAIKGFLASGKAVIVAGPVSNDFMNLGKDQVLTTFNGRSLGGHCYCVVGYDDTKNAFKFLNSWGTSWGTSGFGWISYANITQWWTEAYVLN